MELRPAALVRERHDRSRLSGQVQDSQRGPVSFDNLSRKCFKTISPDISLTTMRAITQSTDSAVASPSAPGRPVRAVTRRAPHMRLGRSGTCSPRRRPGTSRAPRHSAGSWRPSPASMASPGPGPGTATACTARSTQMWTDAIFGHNLINQKEFFVCLLEIKRIIEKNFSANVT